MPYEGQWGGFNIKYYIKSVLPAQTSDIHAMQDTNLNEL